MQAKKKKGGLMDLGRQMQEIVDRSFRQALFADPAAGSSYVPFVDIAETPEAVHVVLEVPGVAREDIEVNVEGDLLRIQGRRREFLPEDVVRYHHLEIDRGGFQRLIQLPPGYLLSEADARLEHGLLHVRLPKKGERHTIIEVNRKGEGDDED